MEELLDESASVRFVISEDGQRVETVDMGLSLIESIGDLPIRSFSGLSVGYSVVGGQQYIHVTVSVLIDDEDNSELACDYTVPVNDLSAAWTKINNFHRDNK